MTDLNEDHPLLFTKQNEFHPFVATAVSLQKGVVVPIVPVSEYAWSWEPWVTSDDKVLQAETSPTDPTAATVTADNKNGNAFVVATLHISEDTVQIPSTTGRDRDALREPVAEPEHGAHRPVPRQGADRRRQGFVAPGFHLPERSVFQLFDDVLPRRGRCDHG